MLYSNIPRTLVYEDKKDLYYFLGNNSSKTLEREFYERLIKCSFISNSAETQKDILSVFNNACYICLLIVLESNPILYLNTYMIKAAEGTDNADLKSHFAAATMALVYNWLGIHVYENNWLSTDDIDITALKQNIYNSFSDKISTMPELQEDFFALILNDDTLQTNIDNNVFNLRDIVDIKESFVIPIEDVAQGIDFILESYEPAFNNKDERIGFISQILDRFEEEKSIVTNIHILKIAKEKLKFEKRRLKTTPDEKPILDGVSAKMLSPNEIDIFFSNHDFFSEEGNNGNITPEMDKYLGWIIDSNKAKKIISKIRHYMEGKKSPKDIVMPIRAAIDAGAIRKPTPTEFKKVFGSARIKSKSSLDKYCKEDTMLYFGNIYNNMVENFKLILAEEDSE